MKLDKKITVNGETYTIDSVLGIVPPGVPAHRYHQYWDNSEFLQSSFLELQRIIVEKVADVTNVTPHPARTTYYYSDATFIAQGGFGKVYKATKYRSAGTISTTPYVVKVVSNLAAAQKECAEYASVTGTYFIHCYGATGDTTKGYAVLDDAGKDIGKVLEAGTISESQRKTIMKGLLTGLKVLKDDGKVHRDIKPANVCFRSDKVKIIDLGLLFNYGTDATLENRGMLRDQGTHGTPFYSWPALKTIFRYRSSDRVSTITKQAYVDRVKPKFYLVDLGGAFVTHLEMITKFTDDEIDNAGDVFAYFDTEVATGTFYTRNGISDNEKAVLVALKDTTKTFEQVLALAWFA